jgi:hypothetical protein
VFPPFFASGGLCRYLCSRFLSITLSVDGVLLFVCGANEGGHDVAPTVKNKLFRFSMIWFDGRGEGATSQKSSPDWLSPYVFKEKIEHQHVYD